MDGSTTNHQCNEKTGAHHLLPVVWWCCCIAFPLTVVPPPESFSLPSTPIHWTIPKFKVEFGGSVHPRSLNVERFAHKGRRARLIRSRLQMPSSFVSFTVYEFEPKRTEPLPVCLHKRKTIRSWQLRPDVLLVRACPTFFRRSSCENTPKRTTIGGIEATAVWPMEFIKVPQKATLFFISSLSCRLNFNSKAKPKAPSCRTRT